jgi:hemolysin activation/secretion protein
MVQSIGMQGRLSRGVGPAFETRHGVPPALGRPVPLRTRIARGSFLVLILLALVPLPGQAQPTPADVDQAGREVQRIQQELRERQERDRQEQQSKQPRTVIEVPPEEKSPPGDAGPCRDIKEIAVDGASLMSLETRDAITAPFIGKCLGVTDIENLLGAITAHYIGRGYIGVRAYIQTQDLEKGTLRVLVVEGEVEGLQIEDGGRKSVSPFNAFPGVVGEPLNLRDFEQGLDQVNRLSSNNATLELQPGEKAGGTVVVIKNAPKRIFHGGTTFDNYGGESSGREQVGLLMSIDNPIGLNDSFSVAHRRTTGKGFDDKHSRSTSLIYSIPFGYFTLTGSQIFSDYATPVRLPTTDLTAAGDTDTSSLQLDYVVHRDQVSRISLASTLSIKDSENTLAGIPLAASTRKLSSIDLFGSWNTQFGGGAFTSRLGATQGLKVFGAYDDPSGLPDDAPTAQYLKYEAALSWSRPFLLSGQTLVFGSSLNSQWSDDVLYGIEQFSIGSIFSVRGYRRNSLTGDRGVFVRNDLSVPRTVQWGTVALNLRPYLGLDAGRIAARNRQVGGNLTGAAAGVVLAAKGATLDMQCASSLSRPSSLDSEGALFFANLSYNF